MLLAGSATGGGTDRDRIEARLSSSPGRPNRVRTAVIRTTHPIALEAALAAVVAATLAALLTWLGPPGSDLAAHVYQSSLFHERGFTLWNNFWYSGRYSFVTYSTLYYPLASLLGIRLLAVASIATAALAFTVVVARQWGPAARWSNRSFAVVWAGIVLSGAFPFALGIALALLALLSLQAGARGRFALLAALTLAASPVAFALLAVLLLASAMESRWTRAQLSAPAATIAAIGLVEVLLWRLFPGNGRYPFSGQELAAASVFCLIGIGMTWRVPAARMLRWIFVVYLMACVAVYLVPSDVGENIARLRFAAIPIAILALALRQWRPLLPCLVALGLAMAWNVSPLAASFSKGRSDPAAVAAYWAPTISFLRAHLTPDYRVEAVDTSGHWPAEYLPSAGIPIVRGWFRQNDFPQNSLLYRKPGRAAYLRWLRSLGVRYVVLPDASLDYSAQHEAKLLAGGTSGLPIVYRSAHTTVFEVPSPTPLVTGPGRARVLALEHARLLVKVGAPGSYRVAASWSPYWKTNRGCLARLQDGMIELTVKDAGVVKLTVDVSARAALATLEGRRPRRCAP
jgi:hypothetical protein